MNIEDINNLLAELDKNRNRETMLTTAFALLEFMGLPLPAERKERVLAPRLEKLKDYLITHPLTRQPQFYRLTEKDQHINIRLGVLKKFRKDQLLQLIDKENPLNFQNAPAIIQKTPSAPPYLIHLVSTPEFDRIYVVLNKGDQKRIVSLRKKLTQTQFQKILPQWKDIGAKSKPEVAEQLWKSFDLKEVNKDFYKLIKEQFDGLLGIAEVQQPKADKEEVKQFAVRLIGRYIFCWFLKEKGIIPEKLLSSATIQEHKKDFSQTYLTQLFFKTLNEEVQTRSAFQSGTALDELYNNIPYLNGGLFDIHPDDKLFKKLDLNDWLIAFVKVLENFDFTVDESNSQYQLVAIDPEMLGRIFENLLASQNEETSSLANQRKAFGAFYTPREIVDYMVNESLKAHLETQLLPPDIYSNEGTTIYEPIVAYKGSLFSEVEPQQTQLNLTGKELAEKADNERKRARIKEHIEKLFAPDCTENPFDKSEVQAVRNALRDITILDPACGSGAFPMGVLLRLMELRQIVGHGHKNNYELKNEILSRNIFGVDIMPMAVEIARLRAWLSLVLEADYKPADRKNNFGVSALPNLDFKFVCANSLIDSGYDEFLKNVHHNATLYRLDGEIQKLETLRDNYFDPKGDKQRKIQLQKEFTDTKNHIKTNFKSLRKSWNLEDFLNKVDDWNPFDDSKPSSFFSPAWMFGIKDGFDVVIGNPPWGADLSKEDKNIYKVKYPEIDSSTPNSFSYFIGFAKRNFRTSFNFVLPDSILVKDFEKTRRLISDNIKTIQWYQNTGLPEELRPFIFVEHDVCVINASSDLTDQIKINLFPYSNGKVISIEKQTFKSKIFLNQFGYVYNLLLGDEESNILNKINKFNNIDYLEAHEGIHTGNARNLLFSKDCQGTNCKDLFYGASAGDIINNFYSETSGWKVNYDKNKIEKESGNYASLREERIFINPKIYITRTGNPFKAFYDEKTYASNNFFSLQFKKLKDNTEENLKFTLPFFLSTLCQFFIRRFAAPRLGMTFVETKIIHLLKFKIPNPNSTIRKIFINKVDEITALKQQNQDTTTLEKEIDVLVYKLYELSYEEVKVIDKDFWMSEEEYGKVEIKEK